MLDTEPSHLIIGAGPVGLTAAIELKRRGINAMIIDNDGEPTTESRALAINARSLDIFEPSGITERLIKAGNKIEEVIVKKNNQQIFQLDLTKIPHKYNFMLCLPQSETEQILIDYLKEQNHAINWYTSLENISLTSAGFQCFLKDLQEGEDAVPVMVETGNLIGADGAHSFVRNSLQFTFDGESLPDVWSLADVQLKNWPHSFNKAVINFTELGPLAFLPIKEGMGRLISPNKALLDQLPKGVEVEKTIWQSDFKISYRQVSTYQKSNKEKTANAFLAGDAAHIHSPAGGRGMNLGIEDAATLAYLMAENRTSEYSNLRHPIGQKVLKRTKSQTNQITTLGGPEVFFIKYIAPIVFSIKPMRNALFSSLAGLDSPTPEWLK